MTNRHGRFPDQSIEVDPISETGVAELLVGLFVVV